MHRSLPTALRSAAVLAAVGLLLFAASQLLYPLRSTAHGHFDVLTVQVPGVSPSYTTFDQALIERVQLEVSRSSPLHGLQRTALAFYRSLAGPVSVLPTGKGRTDSSPEVYQLVFHRTPVVRGAPVDSAHSEDTLTVLYRRPGLFPFHPGQLQGKSGSSPPSPRALDVLEALAAAAQRHATGLLVTWETAEKLFPRFAVAEIVDLQTGAQYFVQRRAGEHHADVQPLTAHDTATMKNTFGNEWSWDRRPVLVKIGTLTLAGSINGRPHGAGRIRANNFPGHCCLYFLRSRTHTTNKLDPEHLLTVLRAAGIKVVHTE